MRVICADPSPISLFGLNKRIKRILPESVIQRNDGYGEYG